MYLSRVVSRSKTETKTTGRLLGANENKANKFRLTDNETRAMSNEQQDDLILTALSPSPIVRPFC